MRCVKNNRIVQDPHTESFPSTYWLGDEYQCPGCDCRIVTGFGKALAEEPHVSPSQEPLEFDYERPTQRKEATRCG
jgi:hypothetical protein